MIKVIRYSWFDRKRLHIRFTEHSPDEHHEDRDVCCCTRAVYTRPEGPPKSVNQHVEVHEVLGDWDVEVDLKNIGYKFWYGPEVRNLPPKREYDSFRFTPDSMKTHIGVPGCGLTDVFFGNLYRGNKVDISQFMNGHSPSQIVHLNTIKEDQLWVHDCDWGHEAMRMLPRSDEHGDLSKAMDEAQAIQAKAASYVNDTTIDVHAVREKVEADKDLLRMVTLLRDRLADILRNIKQTDLFQLCEEARKESRQQSDMGEDMYAGMGRA